MSRRAKFRILCSTPFFLKLINHPVRPPQLGNTPFYPLAAKTEAAVVHQSINYFKMG